MFDRKQEKEWERSQKREMQIRRLRKAENVHEWGAVNDNNKLQVV